MRHLTETRYLTLRNGVELPRIGLGCSHIELGCGDLDAYMKLALDSGYALFDTAKNYGNEAILGRALRESGYRRSEYILSTKLDSEDQGYDSTLRAFEKSLENCGGEYLDMYIIHEPAPELGLYSETWRAMERLYEEKLIRAIGVSNFRLGHLKTLLEDCVEAPHILQMEYNPYTALPELHAFCREKGIQLEAYFPLGGWIFTPEELAANPLIKQGDPPSVPLLENPVVTELARERGRTPAQIVLRWEMQNGVVPIPKTTKKERLLANIDVFDFSLTWEEMERLAALDQDFHLAPLAP